MNSKLLVGIDIGWSEKKRSSAVAVIGGEGLINWQNGATSYAMNQANGGLIRLGLFRHSELLDFLKQFQSRKFAELNPVIVIDGPLGPTGRPQHNRGIDSAFRKGKEFNGRMQPADVASGDGPAYVNATYAAVNAILGNCERFTPWLGEKDVDGYCIAETHPTVGLALLNKKFRKEEIPSRSKPYMFTDKKRSEPAIRAKSDFYWRTGGDNQIARLLRSDTVESERHHERVAGLYCLATAQSISLGRSIVVGCRKSGVYCFPCSVHNDWKKDVETVGIISGGFCELPTIETTFNLQEWSFSNAVAETTTGNGQPLIEDDMSDKGDDDYLVLNDNGGVTEKHNDWLIGFDTQCKVKSLLNDSEMILNRAGQPGQWTIAPTANRCAKAHGLDVPHLSAVHSISIPVRVLE